MRIFPLGLEDDEEGNEEGDTKEAGEEEGYEEEIEMVSEEPIDIGDVPPPT